MSQYSYRAHGASGRSYAAALVPIAHPSVRRRKRPPPVLGAMPLPQPSGGRLEAKCAKCGEFLGLTQPDPVVSDHLIGHCYRRRCRALHLVDAAPLQHGLPCNVTLIPEDFWSIAAVAYVA